MKKLNGENNYEFFEVILSEKKQPIAYANKLKCLMSSGMTEFDARVEIDTVPIELELYYEVGAGLMAVESGAVESGTIYSPYDGKLYQDENYVSPEEHEQFFDDWGQTHEEICTCLGYDEDTSDDLLTDDYFWVASRELWCNKSPHGTKRDEEIAEILRFKTNE